MQTQFCNNSQFDPFLALIDGKLPMANETINAARLMKMVDAFAELCRQGLAEPVAEMGFDPRAMPTTRTATWPNSRGT